MNLLHLILRCLLENLIQGEIKYSTDKEYKMKMHEGIQDWIQIEKQTTEKRGRISGPFKFPITKFRINKCEEKRKFIYRSLENYVRSLKYSFYW